MFFKGFHRINCYSRNADVGGNNMKKIVVAMICAGMTVGLAIGIGVEANRNTRTVSAAIYPDVDRISSFEPCSIENFLWQKEFSKNTCWIDNSELNALTKELEELKYELRQLEKNSAEYNEVVAKIYTLWGQVSILLGELNSRIDIKTDSLLKFAEAIENRHFFNCGTCGKIRYHVEETFE